MKTTTISDRDAFELANGRVPARPDLDELADLLTAYRSAAIGSAPRPSAALSARLDLSATPIAMQRDAVADGAVGANTRRAASGLLGLGVTVAIILGAASGAAAVVGAGSAGSLPPGAQDAFDQVVSLFTPPGVVGVETTDQGEVPGTSTGPTTPTVTEDDILPADSGEDGSVEDASTTTGPGNSGSSNGNSGNGNSGNGNGNSGNGNGGSTSTETAPGNSGSSNGNSGNGNSGNGNGNGGSTSTDTAPGNSGSSNGNSGAGNSGNGNGNGGSTSTDTAPGNSGSSNGNSGNGNSKKP